MLAAEKPSVDGHLAASTPRRRGMDCKPSNNANKKLVQARLPFKRLNPEPTENQKPKRPCAPPCPDPGISDGQNETESSPLPVRNGPALVNGRGPLDGFLSRSRSALSDENMVIDLTEEDKTSLKKCHAPPVSSSPCLPAKDSHQGKDKRASTGKSSKGDRNPETHALHSKVVVQTESDEKVEEMEEEDKDKEEAASISQLDEAQDSKSEEEEQEESVNADVSSLGDRSMLSPSSTSATSAAESSPEHAKTEGITAATEPKMTPKIPTTPKIPAGEKKVKRRSLKSLQEQEERLRLRQKKEREREEAKAEKEKKKEDARKQKEEREREKREKKEKDEQEKREKKEREEKEKADRLKAKEEQRKSKQEAKLEEKRKKEEEKQLKEEKDRLKAEKAGISRFLQKPKTQQAPKTLATACGKFAPFEVKENMFLAPLCRVQCEDSVLEELDQYLLEPADNMNRLGDWIRKKRRSGPTKPRRTDPLRECAVVEGTKPDGVPDRKRYGAMKLLQFHLNHRPAYWGTWSKDSSHISPRCPFRQDKDLLDYEVDSDDEWEEEEPGESLSHSEGEDEEQGGDNDDDDDDGFFVPHGYLSDGEGALEEEEGGDLEKQKVRQRLKAREWDEQMSTKKKVKVLEAVVRGCIWEGEGPTLESFQPYTVCLIEPLPKPDNSPSPEETSQRRKREEQLLGQLLPLLHGNVNSSKVIITEFQEFCRQQTATSSSSSPSFSSPLSSVDNIPTRMHVKRLIKDNAFYEKRRCCWYVHTDVLSHFSQEALPVPCQWTYLTTGARGESREEPQAATGSHGNSPTTPQSSSTTPSSSNKRKSAGSMSITRFMKKCSDPEQTKAMETDGFQADTEEDDEDDCIIITTQSDSTRVNSSSHPVIKSEGEGEGQMEVTPSEEASLPLSSAAPTLDTA